MTTSATRKQSSLAQAIGLVIGDEDFTVRLADGRRITTPYRCFPRLERASMKQRRRFDVYAEGRMLHWPDIDEDIEVQHVVEGRMPVKLDKRIMAVAEERATYGTAPRGAKSRHATAEGK